MAPTLLVDGFTLEGFSGTAIGSTALVLPKFGVIDVQGGDFSGKFFIAELAPAPGRGVIELTTDGVDSGFSTPAFDNGIAGVDIDAVTADQPFATAGLYGGSDALYAMEVTGGNVNVIAPDGTWSLFSATGADPGGGGLMFDRTPGFKYGGYLYAVDWGEDATDSVIKIDTGGTPSMFADLTDKNPRYLAFDNAMSSPYGNLMWVTCSSTGEILSVNPNGTVNTALATLQVGIEGLAFGPGGTRFGRYMYVTNLAEGTLDRVLPDGTVEPIASGFPGTAYLHFVTTGAYAVNGLPTLYIDDGFESVWRIIADPEESVPTTGVVRRPIRRLRRAPHLTEEKQWIFYQRFQLDLEVGAGLATGQGSDPQLMLRWSDDGGHTWSHEHWVSAGQLGAYRWRAIWRRLGRSRDRVFEIAMSDPVKVAWIDAYLSLAPGTH